jgi:hypothetical protein
LEFLDKSEDTINKLKPKYKQIKYALPTLPIETSIDMVLQGIDDSRRNDLSVYQKGWRIIIKGAGTAATDIVSNYAGDVGGGALGTAGCLLGPHGCGIGAAIGYFTISYITSNLVDNFLQNAGYPTLFNSLNLGNYQVK